MAKMHHKCIDGQSLNVIFGTITITLGYMCPCKAPCAWHLGEAEFSCPGAGVKAVSSRQGRQREVRFGSVAFSTEALGGRESAAVRDAAAQHGSGRIVSVLVDSEAGSSSPGLEPSIIR